MTRLVLGFAVLLAMAVPAAAGGLKAINCADDESTSNARNIATPWEKNTRLFSNGAVRLALLDTGGEPVCCSQHLLALYPGGGDPDVGLDAYNNCSIVNPADQSGFVQIDFAKIAASYDPKKGLLVTVPYQLYNDGNPSKTVVGKFLINSKTGKITPVN
jgi:hypothetical protein